MKNTQDFKSLTLDELKGRLSSERETLERLNFSHAVTPLENPMSIRVAKKNIARILTELTRRSKAN